MRKTIPVKNVLGEDENIYFEGKPNKIAFIVNECNGHIKKIILEILLNFIIMPVLFFAAQETLTLPAKVLIAALWFVNIIFCLEDFGEPFKKARDWENVYYIITDQSIYMQFGYKKIYYREYPKERIGTKVFYRRNKIDDLFGVGTLGFSVDDYYEERLYSIKDYEDVYTVLKDITNEKREEQLKEEEIESMRKQLLEKQAKILAQEEEFIREAEEKQRENAEKYANEIDEDIEIPDEVDDDDIKNQEFINHARKESNEKRFINNERGEEMARKRREFERRRKLRENPSAVIFGDEEHEEKEVVNAASRDDEVIDALKGDDEISMGDSLFGTMNIEDPAMPSQKMQDNYKSYRNRFNKKSRRPKYDDEEDERFNQEVARRDEAAQDKKYNLNNLWEDNEDDE